jgi:hypothetical protein
VKAVVCKEERKWSFLLFILLSVFEALVMTLQQLLILTLEGTLSFCILYSTLRHSVTLQRFHQHFLILSAWSYTYNQYYHEESGHEDHYSNT